MSAKVLIALFLMATVLAVFAIAEPKKHVTEQQKTVSHNIKR